MHYLFKLLSLIISGLALAAALLITAHDLFRCRQWKDVGKALGNFAAMVCGYSTK